MFKELDIFPLVEYFLMLFIALLLPEMLREHVLNSDLLGVCLFEKELLIDC